MVKIICRAVDCIYWEDNLCTSDEITYDPDEGCLTYEVIDDVLTLDDNDEWTDDEDWDDEEEPDEEFEKDGFYIEEEEEDLELYDDGDDDW